MPADGGAELRHSRLHESVGAAVLGVGEQALRLALGDEEPGGARRVAEHLLRRHRRRVLRGRAAHERVPPQVVESRSAAPGIRAFTAYRDVRRVPLVEPVHAHDGEGGRVKCERVVRGNGGEDERRLADVVEPSELASAGGVKKVLSAFRVKRRGEAVLERAAEPLLLLSRRVRVFLLKPRRGRELGARRLGVGDDGYEASIRVTFECCRGAA